jgi:hypothetical protein
MSVSTFLTPDFATNATWDAKSLFRQLGEEVAGSDLSVPSIGFASASFTGTSSGALSAPNISANSVVVITGYNKIPASGSGGWSVAINPTAQTFTITASSSETSVGFNWFIIG